MTGCKHSILKVLSAVVALAVMLPGIALGEPGGVTERVSVASDGTEGNGPSIEHSLSADGRYVAFDSLASNLVPGDTNDEGDVFIRDRIEGTTERVSVASNGIEADGGERPSISADGRYVAFFSGATNLVPGDTNDATDIFVHDRLNATTERVSVASDGTEGNRGSGYPSHPSFTISADGRYVVFKSVATNLVPGDTNDTSDIFVHDRLNGTTERVSVASDGTEANGGNGNASISADGRYVVFESDATNLVPGGTNGAVHVFIHDRLNDTTEQVSVASNGAEGNKWGYGPAVNADGRFVTFGSFATNLVPEDTNSAADIFVRDRLNSTTERVSLTSDGMEANGHSEPGQISADGRYVAFTSWADNLVPGDTNGAPDVFVHDRLNGITERVSVASDGTETDYWSNRASISADGRHVAFASLATNLVPGDTNGEDVFVHSPRQLAVTIDVRPGNGINTVNPRARGRFWVAILSDEGFDAVQVDPASVRLGAGAASPDRYRVRDSNYDGVADLLLRFRTPNVGIVCGDTSIELTGQTYDGVEIVGEDDLRTVGCKEPKPKKKAKKKVKG